MARQNLKCVDFTTFDENLLTESDDIEAFVEGMKIFSFKEALEEVRFLMTFSEEEYTAYERFQH